MAASGGNIGANRLLEQPKRSPSCWRHPDADTQRLRTLIAMRKKKGD